MSESLLLCLLLVIYCSINFTKEKIKSKYIGKQLRKNKNKYFTTIAIKNLPTIDEVLTLIKYYLSSIGSKEPNEKSASKTFSQVKNKNNLHKNHDVLPSITRVLTTITQFEMFLKNRANK